MPSIISPTKYGVVSYGMVSYVAGFSSQIPIIIVSQPLVLESLVNALIPANVKVYYNVQE